MNVFENIGIDYDELRLAHDILIEPLLEIINTHSPGSRILDVGCGSGKYAERIAQRVNREINCIDTSEKLLAIAASKKNVIASKANCNKSIPFPDNFFKLSYNINFVHYIIDIDLFYHDQYRILEEEGTVFTATHSEDDFKKQSLGHYFPETINLEVKKTASIQRLKTAMHNAGFREIEIKNKVDTLKINEHFLEACQKKVYSALHEISKDSFSKGINEIKNDISNGVRGLISYTYLIGQKKL